MKQTSDGLFQHPGLRSFLVKARLPLFIVVLVLISAEKKPPFYPLLKGNVLK